MQSGDAPLLEAVGITKEFPGVRALKGVDIAIQPGQVHGLVGENGAGKSTLIKIFSGLYQQTSGELKIDGKPVKFRNPLDSQKSGISVISQEFQLVPQLSIVENIFLGREPRGKIGQIDWATARKRAAAILERLGMSVSVNQAVELLSIADQQLIEIGKALAENARLIIMDEPTASLNMAEADRLMKIVKELRNDGRSILYVSHRLHEIFHLTDCITVFRDGRRVAVKPTSELTEEELVTLMIGRKLETPSDTDSLNQHNNDSAPIFEVKNLSVPRYVHNVSFNVRSGEIVGIAGLIGSGRRELTRALYGLETISSGEIIINGKAEKINNPTQALQAKLYMLTEDRKEEGIIPHFNVSENIALSSQPKNVKDKFLINQDHEDTMYKNMKNFFNIRCFGPTQGIVTLSGGNQQKVLLGRALAADCQVLLLNEPTRGVDIGAKMEIYKAIRELASTGVAVVVSSSEAQEIVQLVDRCIVLNAGNLVTEISKKDLNEDNIVAASLRRAKTEAIVNG
ncbi:sugar ABC transporter ATP-binding protein [Neobacillus muris]|uniref:sugar ABC transporter ATP-binding protein n=1 Tax=Neobacillus muris TaxID=2941334 RepID=UPI00203D0246|nr:sugar ABC transporter ATP-binding protein [Neobacillus muris]